MLFETRIVRGRALANASTVADYAGQASRYLTDGVDLYRFVGAITGGGGQLIGLENCRSLDVTLWSIGQLHARRLHAVIPLEQQLADRAAPHDAGTACCNRRSPH